MKEINYDQSDEVEKYRKSTQSNVSKSKNKSKHKHQYEECLIQYKSKFSDQVHTGLSSYCTICGKIGGKFDDDKSIVKDYVKRIDTSAGRGYQVMKSEELYEKYHDKIPVFFLGDMFNKYVSLKKDDIKGE